jgi:hypothetical protein
MLAIVSGRACSAFLRRGEETWGRLRYETPNLEEPCSQYEMEHILSETEALTALFDAVDITEAVDLTLWLLDDTLSEATRQSAAEELDELLAYEEIRNSWEGIFYARPLADGTDTTTPQRLALAANAIHVANCLEELTTSQHAIRAVRRAAEAATLQTASTPDDARRREGFCVREGVYREFVSCCLATNLNQARFCFTTSPAHNDWKHWLNLVIFNSSPVNRGDVLASSEMATGHNKWGGRVPSRAELAKKNLLDEPEKESKYRPLINPLSKSKRKSELVGIEVINARKAKVSVKTRVVSRPPRSLKQQVMIRVSLVLGVGPSVSIQRAISNLNVDVSIDPISVINSDSAAKVSRKKVRGKKRKARILGRALISRERIEVIDIKHG